MKLFHMSLVLAILFQAPCKMDSNICKGTKNDFSYFVDMALQNRMPWKTLASLLTDLAPTLNETREVVRILLKELETLKLSLQKRNELLEKYQKENDTFEETEQNYSQEIDDLSLETETINDESVVETEVIEDDNEDLDDFEESINEELYSELNEITDSTDIAQFSDNEERVTEIDDQDSENEIVNNSMNETDDLQFVFVRTDKTSENSSKRKVEQ